MERDTFLYGLRRRIQVMAHKVISNESLSKLYFSIVLNKKLNLITPKTFNEKIQWLKLYYYPQNELVVKCTDKYAVREYIAEKGYAGKLVPLIGVWEDAEEIDWNNLPNDFVLKCNHGCAYNIVVKNKYNNDYDYIKKKLNRWLKEDFGAFNVEVHYSAIKKHLITCERFLGDKLVDYKFFCFHGKPYCVYVSTDLLNDRQAKIGFFYLNGNKMPLSRDDYTNIDSVVFPPFYNEMVKAAEDLSVDFPFVRVDFFITDKKWYFAELTFTPSAGMMPFNPEKYDLLWGEMLHIENLL